jgi:hypothetical protein
LASHPVVYRGNRRAAPSTHAFDSRFDS